MIGNFEKTFIPLGNNITKEQADFDIVHNQNKQRCRTFSDQIKSFIEINNVSDSDKEEYKHFIEIL